MSDQERSVHRDAVATWMISCDALTRAQAFQILDTAYAHLVHYGSIPGLATLQIPPAVAHLTATLQPYLTGLTTLEFWNELALLAYIRPNEVTILPLLAPKPLTAADIEARVAQEVPSQTTLTTLADLPTDLKDHATFGMVQNYQHALAIEAELLAVNNKKGDAAVEDATDAPQDQAAWVTMKEELCAAIVDFAKTAEVPGSSRYKQVAGLTNIEVEVIAAKLLEATIQAQHGNIGIPGDKLAYEKYPSLNDRLDNVKRAVRNSKCNVASMMSVANLEFAKRLAARPVAELDTKVSNAVLNKSKANQLKAAKKATETGDATAQQDGTITYRDGSQFTAAPNAVEQEIKAGLPNKRKRKANDAVSVSVAPHQTAVQHGPSQHEFVHYGFAQHGTVHHAPVQRAPVQRAPVQRAPVQRAPVQHAPGQDAPAQYAPIQHAPVQHAPVQHAPVQRAPLQRAPVQHAPGQDAPAQYAPIQHAPIQHAPVQHAPVQRAPLQRAPLQHAPGQDALAQYAPIQHAPVQTAPGLYDPIRDPVHWPTSLQPSPVYQESPQPPMVQHHTVQQPPFFGFAAYDAPMQQDAAEYSSSWPVSSGNTSTENPVTEELTGQKEPEDWEEYVNYCA